MSDRTVVIADLLANVDQFRTARHWEQYHTPANLAQSISIEAAELLELFQWGNQPRINAIQDELADVLIYCLNLASVLEIDVSRAIFVKIEKNASKYPVPDIVQEVLPCCTD
jgi:NTP pyrophosphatase (non-canonical NTP hydrolase)